MVMHPFTQKKSHLDIEDQMLINPYVDILITNTFLADRDADLMDIMMVSTIEDVSGGARPCLSRKAQELLRQQKIPQLPFFCTFKNS